MTESPVIEPIYVAARSVLLDALMALEPQADAVVVVGAQAVYLRTGSADIAFAPFTSDADLALVPALLAADPLLEDLMTAAGFQQSVTQPGSWLKDVRIGETTSTIPVDLMVPEALVPKAGRRGARISPHSRTAARKTPGLEAAVVDKDLMTIASFDPDDSREVSVRVAGATALLVAKLHKLADRVSDARESRLVGKDASDVYRLMQATPIEVVTSRLATLSADETSAEVTAKALMILDDLFGRPGKQGVRMAVAALEGVVPAARVEGVCTAFVGKVLL